MAKVAATSRESAMSTGRRRVLLGISDPASPVSVVVPPGSRYFITVVTFTHISDLATSVLRLHPQTTVCHLKLHYVGGRLPVRTEVEEVTLCKRACE